MPRTRLINPEFFLHEGLGSCSPHARLLFVALWTQADREGRLRWLPLKIHGESFPHEPEVDVPALAAELIEAGSLQVYESQGRAFALVSNFTRWQSPHRNESASKIPKPPEANDEDSLALLGYRPRTKGQPKDDQGTASGEANTSYQLLVTSRPSKEGSSGRRRGDVLPEATRLIPPTGDELLDFLLTTWGGLLGKHETLAKWVGSSRGAYPGIDLLAEARRAHAWEEANPQRKKKQVRSFLSRWWTKAQDSGRAHTTTNREDPDGAAALEVARSLGADL